MPDRNRILPITPGPKAVESAMAPPAVTGLLAMTIQNAMCTASMPTSSTTFQTAQRLPL